MGGWLTGPSPNWGMCWGGQLGAGSAGSRGPIRVQIGWLAAVVHIIAIGHSGCSGHSGYSAVRLLGFI